MKKIIALSILIFSINSFCDTAGDFESLGGNKVLLDKAKALNPETEISIVQDRIVSRRNRIEIAPEFSGSFGGDTYTKTQGVALNLNYHISPRWSLGAKYSYNFNQLTSEGSSLVDKAYDQYKKDPQNPNSRIPETDYPMNDMYAVINWYPIYGKMNLLDQGIAHFDLYLLAGYGKVTLKSGSSGSSTAGGGFGIWWNNHFSTRLEMRYQGYKAKYSSGDMNLDLAVASVQMGWLL